MLLNFEHLKIKCTFVSSSFANILNLEDKKTRTI